MGAQLAEGDVGEAAKTAIMEVGENASISAGAEAGALLFAPAGPEASVFGGLLLGMAGYFGFNSGPVQESINGVLDTTGQRLREHEAMMQQGAKEMLTPCGMDCY